MGVVMQNIDFTTAFAIIVICVFIIGVLIAAFIVYELSKPDPTVKPPRFKRRTMRDNLAKEFIYETEPASLYSKK